MWTAPSLYLAPVLELIANDQVVAYKQHMVTVTRTEEYASWFRKLRDARAQSRILTRIDRLLEGNAATLRPSATASASFGFTTGRDTAFISPIAMQR
jgi:hypothetical protein